MLNIKYLVGVLLYFVSVNELVYIFVVGFYYVLQDYFLMLLSYFEEFYSLSSSYKEELKYLLVLITFVSCLF